jgi:Zn-dependent peptidase ImmA (M78 family)/DNA-binding XRE family transcriptional regulator
MSRDYLNGAEIGERLRVARETADITQAAAATSINIARTTLVAIEKGQRRIRTDELQKLARVYKTSVNSLLRHESVSVDLIPRFRKLQTSTYDASDVAAGVLTNLVKAEVELENLLSIKRSRNYPPERPIMPGNVNTQAENDAIELRQWLGLGLSPVRDLISLLELDIGVRVYIRRLDPQISGLFAYDKELGACMLLNASHPRERRTQTAAHEIGHFISTRQAPDVLHVSEQENSREERYANAFARAFLTPARTVMQRFREITAGSPHFTRRHVILLAHVFGVSREAIVRRLEELNLVEKGTWDWFQDNDGITDAQVRQVLGDLVSVDMEKNEADRPTTLRLNLLASEAWRQEILSEGQLARLLLLNRVELREIIDNIEIGGGEADEMPKLSA